MWFIVCIIVPVRNLFSIFHSFRCNVDPTNFLFGFSIRNLFEKLWLPSQNNFPDALISNTGNWTASSIHIGTQDISRRDGGFSSSYLIGRLCSLWSSTHFFHSLFAACFRLRCGGAIFVVTCNQGSGVESTPPAIILVAMLVGRRLCQHDYGFTTLVHKTQLLRKPVRVLQFVRSHPNLCKPIFWPHFHKNPQNVWTYYAQWIQNNYIELVLHSFSWFN